MRIKVPFTKDKFIDLSVKSDSFIPLTGASTYSELIGFNQNLDSQKTQQKLIDEGYSRNVTVYAIIKMISQAGADIPKLLIDKRTGDVIDSGEVYDFVQRPAIYQGEELNQYDYFEILLTLLLASGNVYQRGLTSVGFGDIWQQLEIYPSGFMSPVAGNSYLSPIQYYQFKDKQQNYNIPFEEMIHTKFVNPSTYGLNNLIGLSPLQAAIFSLTGSNDIQKAISVMIKNQGARGILSNKSERPLKPEEAKALSDKVNQEIRGVSNFNKVHVTSIDTDYKQIGMSANDLKVIESGILTDRQLCNAFGVSSRLFNDPANSTFNNVKEAEKSMYNKTVIPTCNKLLQDFNYHVLSQYSKRDRKQYELILDTSELEVLQSDQKLEAEKDKIQLDGINTILLMPLTSEAKQLLLIETYGINEEHAKILAP